MSDVEHKPYPEVMERIGELAEALLNNPNAKVAARAEEMLDWIDVFHREGLTRLVGMVEAWRGEIFLESAAEDAVAGALLDAYDLRDLILPDGPSAPAVPPPQPTVVQIRRKQR